jgi:hypothetical protein
MKPLLAKNFVSYGVTWLAYVGRLNIKRNSLPV